MRTSILGKVRFVASKYDPETRAKAVRLVLEHRDDYPSEWAAAVLRAITIWLNH
jgi:transposase